MKSGGGEPDEEANVEDKDKGTGGKTDKVSREEGGKRGSEVKEVLGQRALRVRVRVLQGQEQG